MGDRLEAAKAASTMAMSFMARGEFEPAEQLLDGAITIGRILASAYDLADFLLNKANVLSAQERLEEALEVFAETLQLAAETENTSTQFEAQLSRIRTQVDLGQKTPEIAIEQLHQLRDAWEEHFEGDTEQEAHIHYEIWKLDHTQAHHQSQAAQMYAHLYEHTPNYEYRQRYLELTGELLPDPVPLPPLPEIVTRRPVHLQTLLHQLNALIQEAETETHFE